MISQVVPHKDHSQLWRIQIQMPILEFLPLAAFIQSQNCSRRVGKGQFSLMGATHFALTPFMYLVSAKASPSTGVARRASLIVKEHKQRHFF